MSKRVELLLRKAAASLEVLGEDFNRYLREIEWLRERLASARFHLAVLGQFKRGKSTLLNALLGAEVLPTSVVPLTAIPTFILWGETFKARVVYQDARGQEEFSYSSVEDLAEFLSQYVTEENNPRNIKGVSHVEVYYPSPLLEQGVVLIDTPGIGSTYQHNTVVTLNFLSQCDAALFLVSADPPITEVELQFLKAVRPKVARLFFIINKVDYLSGEEQEKLLSFIRDVLREGADIQEDTTIFCISARQGLEARKAGDEQLWKSSGLAEVQEHLIDFFARDKAAALKEAIASKAQDLINEAMMTIELTIRSLQLPLEDLDERLGVFEEKLQEAERERILIGDLLVAERNRMVERLEAEAENLRKEACDNFERVMCNSLKDSFDENKTFEALKSAIPDFFENKFGTISNAFDEKLKDTLRPYEQKVNGLVEAVRKTAADVFEIPYMASRATGGLEISRGPIWVTHRWDANIRLLPENFLDRFLPQKVRRKRLFRRLSDQIQELVTYNVENLRWALLQSLDEAFRKVRSGLEERLQETIAATRRAIQSARSKRLDKSEAVALEVDRLEKIVGELKEIQEKLEAVKSGKF
ncbi:MAG: dynamin family protein [Thermacetogeniaceae bacterium]